MHRGWMGCGQCVSSRPSWNRPAAGIPSPLWSQKSHEGSMPHIIGDNIDRLVTVEMRTQGIVRGNIVQLYEAARAKQGAPLTMLAADRLHDAIRPDDVVLI